MITSKDGFLYVAFTLVYCKLSCSNCSVCMESILSLSTSLWRPHIYLGILFFDALGLEHWMIFACAFLYKLELEYIPGYTGVVLLCAVLLVFTTGISHSPSRGFIMPYITMVLFFIATNFLLFNTTRQLLSRNYPIDIRDALCRPGKTISVCAFDNNCFEMLMLLR